MFSFKRGNYVKRGSRGARKRVMVGVMAALQVVTDEELLRRLLSRRQLRQIFCVHLRRVFYLFRISHFILGGDHIGDISFETFATNLELV